jgi:hypothetical protein
MRQPGRARRELPSQRRISHRQSSGTPGPLPLPDAAVSPPPDQASAGSGTVSGHAEARRFRRGITRPLPAQPASVPATSAADEPSTARTGTPSEPLLYTAEQAAVLLQVRPSWLRRKAAARAVPCRFMGKHLRFSRADIETIAEGDTPPTHRSV